MTRPSPQTDRVVAVVRLLAAHPDEGFTISEIARRLQLHKATCYPMINALTANGWLARDGTTKEFRLGPALVAVGEAATRSAPATAHARPVLLELSERYGVTCAALTREHGADHATLADQVWDVRSTVPPLRIGQRIPLRAPFGAVFVAWSSPDAIERWAGDDDPARRRRYASALAAVRDRGFAVELRTPPEERLRADSEPAGGTAEASAGPLGVAPAPADVERLVDELADEPEFLPTSLSAERTYAVSTLAAPVFWPDGSVRLGLALLGFGPALRGSGVLDAGRRLCAAADRVGRELLT